MMSDESASSVLPIYAKGEYFKDAGRHAGEAEFKARELIKILDRLEARENIKINSIADVGCGSGDIIKTIDAELAKRGRTLNPILAYDVSPHVSKLSHERIKFAHGDFAQIGAEVDLATLFDVFEHVPDPVSFIRRVAAKARYIAFHVPLDDSWNVKFRNLFLPKLRNPGHITFLNTASALNLLTAAGLAPVDFHYTMASLTIPEKGGLGAKITNLLRRLIWSLSPWLLSATLGGPSLMVLCKTPRGYQSAAP